MTQLATHNALNSVWTPEQVETIKRTVAVGATDEELKMFLHLASKYDLDPFAHEIWYVRMGDRNTIMTGRDGYLKIAHMNPCFAGMVSDAVYEGDKFMRSGNMIHHSYEVAKRGKLIGAYAMVHRYDKLQPFYFFAPFNNYNKGRSVWLQYPHAMIVKVAEAMALKRAFPISGLVTQEEVAPNLKLANNEFSDNLVFEPQAPVENQEGHDEVDIKQVPYKERPFEARIRRKKAIWNSFLKLHEGDEVSAEGHIKRIVGDKPSGSWSITDMVALEKYLMYSEGQVRNNPENNRVNDFSCILEDKKPEAETAEIKF